MKLYRCQAADCSTDRHGRLIFDFWAKEPKCPKCGIHQDEPRLGNLIVELAIIHYEPPGRSRGIGKGHIACNPGQPVGSNELGGGTLASADPIAVSCPKCRQVESWQAAADARNETVAPQYDFELCVDPKTLQVQKIEV